MLQRAVPGVDAVREVANGLGEGRPGVVGLDRGQDVGELRLDLREGEHLAGVDDHLVAVAVELADRHPRLGRFVVVAALRRVSSALMSSERHAHDAADHVDAPRVRCMHVVGSVQPQEHRPRAVAQRLSTALLDAAFQVRED